LNPRKSADFDQRWQRSAIASASVGVRNQQSAISNADEQMQALSASISVSHY